MSWAVAVGLTVGQIVAGLVLGFLWFSFREWITRHRGGGERYGG